MKIYGLGEYRSINSFVEAKLKAFASLEKSYASLFELMFRESGNVMWEQSEGYRIRKVTYGESKQNIIKKAGRLKELLSGAENNAAVGLYLDNSLDWIETFWAILGAGFRPLLMNMRLPEEALGEALEILSCEAVVTSGKEFACRCINVKELEGGDEKELGSGFGNEIFVMSSGTSRKVKICAYTASEFYYQIIDSYEIIKKSKLMKAHCGGYLKQLAFLPFYHVFGLIAMYIWFAFFSRTFVYLADLSPQTIVNTVKRHRVTHIFAVPLFWEKVYEEALKTVKSRGDRTYKKFIRAVKLWEKLPNGLDRTFSRLAFKEVRENLFGDSIRFLITGGSRIDPEAIKFFNAIGYHLSDGYGMTEIGITSVELSNNKKYLDACFVGSPMSHVEYKLNDEGELLVRGDVIASYIIEDGIKKTRGGFFNTHDLAECVGGRYRILGRKDDLIVSNNGENVNPNLVEPLLAAEGTGGVCLVSGKSGEKDATVLLVSVNRFLSKEKLQKIDADTKERINKASLGGAISRIEYITCPLLGANDFKLDRIRLGEEYFRGDLPLADLSKEDEKEDTDPLTERIKEYFALSLGKDESDIAPDANFFVDGGGTSLDYFAMIAKLKEDFGLPFPADGEGGLATVRQIADYIRKALNG